MFRDIVRLCTYLHLVRGHTHTHTRAHRHTHGRYSRMLLVDKWFTESLGIDETGC